MPNTQAQIALLFDLFDRFGAEHYGEAVSQLQHALQCAQLARDHACSDAMILASLLHDIGRMIDPTGNDAELEGIDARHEVIGAQALSALFGPEVTEPVRLHVDAKRYLCATDAAYAGSLSAASILSLAVQGGAMTADEQDRFEQEPYFADAIQLRRFDDWGKRSGCEVATLESYRPLIEALAAPRTGA